MLDFYDLPIAVNCGGKGGTKGPCPGSGKGSRFLTTKDLVTGKTIKIKLPKLSKADKKNDPDIKVLRSKKPKKITKADRKADPDIVVPKGFFG